MSALAREVLSGQYAAAIATLRRCIDCCPDELWTARVGSYPFAQVVFHTLFFTDVYLCPSPDALRDQDFHRAHAVEFADYEQLQDREPTQVHGRAFITAYADHCRDKAGRVVTTETDDTLAGPSGFARRTFTRAELHVYNIRHVQHHAAQLSLRLRLDAGIDIPWFGSGDV